MKCHAKAFEKKNYGFPQDLQDFYCTLDFIRLILWSDVIMVYEKGLKEFFFLVLCKDLD